MKSSNKEKKIKSPAVSDAADTPLDEPNCSFKATALSNGCISPSKKMKSSNEGKKVESPVVYDAADTPCDKPNYSFKTTVYGCSSPPKRMKSRMKLQLALSRGVSTMSDTTGYSISFSSSLLFLKKNTDAVDPSLPGKDPAVAETKTNPVVFRPLDLGDSQRVPTATPEQVIQLGSPVSCLIPSAFFSGACSGVHVCKVLSKAGLFLPIPAGMVTSLAASNEVLFAGIDDGNILDWKMIANHDDQGKQKHVQFQPAVRLSGHTSVVICLTVRGINLFLGGKDGSIRAWNVTSLEAAQELDVPPAAHEDLHPPRAAWSPLPRGHKQWCQRTGPAVLPLRPHLPTFLETGCGNAHCPIRGIHWRSLQQV